MDLYDIIHYIIAIIIVVSLLWMLIQIHNYLSQFKNPKLVYSLK
jgi:hypothetical protein